MSRRVDLLALFLGCLFALIWASAFTSGRIIVSHVPPLTALGIRFALSGAIGMAIAFALGQRVNLSRAGWKAVIVFGICQNALYLGLNFTAMQWIEASLASIIASAMPLAVALASLLFLRERINWVGTIGLIGGMGGVALIMATRVSGGADLLGVILCIIAVCALTAATLSMRSASSGGNLMMIVGLQMWLGTALLAPVGLLTETWDVTWTTELVVAYTYTVLAPGLLATWVWFVLVDRIGATKAASFHFLNPVFGVATAWVILGESLRPLDAVGVAIVTVSILAVQRSRIKR